MKKLSCFLAAILLLVTTALSLGPAQEVQAFDISEVNYQNFNRYNSAKVGSPLEFRCALSYLTAETQDVSSWKAALCPSDNVTPEAAVAVFNFSNDDKIIDNVHGYAYMVKRVTLASDVPEGYYTRVVWDENGTVQFQAEDTIPYINKTLVSVSCSMMNNDGYAYAYVYAENMPLSAATCPTFYAADKTTPVTSFNDYAVERNQYGEKVHIYRLNILDASQFALDSDGLTYLYYKVGTPCTSISVSGNEAGNDGGFGVSYSDADGFGYTYIYNVNNYIQKYNLGFEATNPFDKKTVVDNPSDTTNNSTDSSAADDDEENDDHDSNDSGSASATATVGGQEVSVTISAIQNSDVPEVQSAINNVVNWTGQIATKPAEVVKILNQYAPSMKVDGVTAGGTLDLAVPGGTDISSGVRITFSDNTISANVKRGDKIIVLHIKHDGSIEYIPAEAGDGTITATFTSLSPIAWFKVSAAGTSNGISPKTGFSFWNYLAELFR